MKGGTPMKNFTHFFSTSCLAMAFMLTGGLSGPAWSLDYDPGDGRDYKNYDWPYDDPVGFDPYYDGYNDDEYDTDKYVLTDSELRLDILSDLIRSPFVDGEDLRVSVKNGIATLSGTVEDRSGMVDAEEMAYDAGARRVRNNLRLLEREERPWEDMSDRELKEEIEDEFTMSPFVDGDRIRVSVKNGVATLSGRVENKGEIADAVENAYEAGAKRVKSRLWVGAHR
jgi:osmotically-inducible protein OsmY